MKKEILKNQKGVAGSDALIAVLIIALFSGLIATISYNIYLSNSSLKRMSKATEYIVDMFEHIDKTYYDDITKENLTNYFNNKYYYENDGVTPKADADVKLIEQDEVSNTPFSVGLNIVKYNETEGNTDKLDLVQEITMTVAYKLGGKDQVIEMTKTKTRENLITPNSPDFKLLNLEDGYYAYPIKKINNNWKVCDETDSSWYNYESGNWALVIKTTRELSLDEEVDTNNLLENEEIYAWIPRYAYESTDGNILFLFSNSNNYVDSLERYNRLTSIDEITDKTYIIPTDFSIEGSELKGIWTSDSSVEVYQILNSEYKLNS